MKLSVVIVNYNVKFFLEQCLVSVLRAPFPGGGLETFVVDNASNDGSVEMLQEKFPSIKLIRNEQNAGFAKANNQAIQVASGEYILLLNPDTVIAEDTFERCLAFMDAHSDAGALGVRMVDGKGNFLPESKRGLPTPAVAFYKMFGLSRLLPKSKSFGRYHLAFLPENETNEVDVLSGAFFMLRKSALDKAGLLDEKFFMYGEDIDLSYRITKAGYKNYYFPETTIIHYKGESTRKGSLNYVKVFYRAMIVFAKKHFSANQSGWFSFFINIAIFFRGLLTVLGNVLSSSYLFIIDALLSFGGIFFIKTYWEATIKYKDHYYPNEFLFIVVPLYIIVWIIATFISGGYDKPFRITNILRGIFFGTMAIAVIYAFLPNEWRFSRAIIILGGIWTAFEMFSTRTAYHLLKHQTLSFENGEEKRSLIAGDITECARAENLLVAAGAESEVLGFVTEKSELKKLSKVYNANEIIFCAKTFSFKEIIAAIDSLGTANDYKILNEKSDVFVGSNSKNTAGDLYSFDHNLNLARPAMLHRKRLFDLAICVALIPTLPLNILLVKNFSQFLSNWLAVFSGRKTWIGYEGEANPRLPVIPVGVISNADEFSKLSLDRTVLDKLNLLYAKHYSLRTDLKLLLQNYSKLGNAGNHQ